MNSILGKKYVDSKGSVIASAIILLILVLGIGGYIYWTVYNNYQNDIWSYEFDLWLYENGYSSYKPTAPEEPIGLYALIISLSLAIGGFLFYLPFLISKNQHSKGDNVVVLDQSSNTIKLLSGHAFHSIHLKDIINVKVENTGFVPAGKIIIPYKHSYGKIIIKYKKGTKTVKVKSNDMQNVEEVAIKIESYRRSKC